MALRGYPASNLNKFKVSFIDGRTIIRLTPIITPTITPSITNTVSPSVTISPSIIVTNTPSITTSITLSNTPSTTPSITISETPSITPSISISETPSITPSISISVTPSISISPTPSITISPTPSITPSTSNPLDGTYYNISDNAYNACFGAGTSILIYDAEQPLVIGEFLYQSPEGNDKWTITEIQTLLNSTQDIFYITGAELTQGSYIVITSNNGDAYVSDTGICVSPTPSISISATPSITPSISISNTPSLSPSISITNTPSRTPSISISNTPSITPSISISNTPSLTPSISISNTPSLTPGISISNTPSTTPSLSISNTPSITPSRSISNTPSITPTKSISITPSITFTPTPTPSPIVPTNTDPTLQIWYDASDPTVFNPSSNNGAAITQWSDKSATAHNAAPLGSISSRPTVTTNFQNGKTVLYFDGNDGLGANMSTVLQSLTGSTMIVVGKATTTGSVGQEQHFIEGARIQGSSYTPLDAYSLIMSGSNGYNVLFAGGKALSDANMDTNFHIHTVVFDGNGSTNADKLKHRVDGVQKTLTYSVNVGSATSATINAMAIGAQGDNTANLTGYIGEVLIYTRTLNLTEITNTENYLKTKWNI